jgi:hypothetical protein
LPSKHGRPRASVSALHAPTGQHPAHQENHDDYDDYDYDYLSHVPFLH